MYIVTKYFCIIWHRWVTFLLSLAYYILPYCFFHLYLTRCLWYLCFLCAMFTKLPFYVLFSFDILWTILLDTIPTLYLTYLPSWQITVEELVFLCPFLHNQKIWEECGGSTLWILAMLFIQHLVKFPTLGLTTPVSKVYYS